MKNFVLFLPGPYRTEHIDFYRKLGRGKVRVAVDGGFMFFKHIGTSPHLLIGDFDSLRSRPSNLPTWTKVISYPPTKDKTDLELALEYCLDNGARSIDIVSPHVGEIDHFLGNIMIMRLVSPKGKKHRLDIRIVNYSYEIRLLVNSRVNFPNAIGDTVSVLPLTPTVSLTCRGMTYPAVNLRLKYGQSRGLRNKIKGKLAAVEVKGEALVVRWFGRRG